MKKILLVEDDSALCETIKSFLDEFPELTLLICSDIEHAHAILEINRIDILLVSVHIYNEGKVGGLIHLAHAWYNSKVIVLTTLPNIDKVKDKLQANYILPKPFSWDALFSIL